MFNFNNNLRSESAAPCDNLRVTVKRTREGRFIGRNVINLSTESNQFAPIAAPFAAPALKKQRFSTKPQGSDFAPNPYQSASLPASQTMERLESAREQSGAPRLPPYVISAKMIHAATSNDIDGLVKIADLYADHFNLLNLNIFFHRLATLCKQQKVSGAKYKQLIEKCQKKLLGLIDELSNRELANNVWAFGKLGVRIQHLMGNLASKATEAAVEEGNFTPFNIYQLWSGFSAFDLNYHGLNEELSKIMLSNINKLNMPDTAMFLFVLSKMKSHDDALIRALCGQIKRQYHSCELRQICGNLRALAILNHVDMELLRALTHEALKRINEFSWTDAYHTLWSLASLEYYDANLTKSLCKRLLESELDCKDIKVLASLAWSLSTLGERDVALMDRLSEAASPKIGDMSWESAIKITWSFANLNIYNEKLIKALIKKVWKNENIPFGYAPLLGWAFTIFNVQLPENLQKILINPPERPEAKTVELRQAYLAALANSLDTAKLSRILESPDTKQPRSSDTHILVSKAIEKLGYVVVNEVNFPNAKHVWFDISAKKGNKEIILEVDGPDHFTRDGTEIGKTVLKNVIARRLGFEVVHVIAQEWSRRSDRGKINYLKSLGIR